jgi:hypothetical protein
LTPVELGLTVLSFFPRTHFHIFSWFLHLIPRSVMFQTQKYNNN